MRHQTAKITIYFMPDTETLRGLLDFLNSHGAKLIAVSKTKTPSEILEVYEAGHKIFGENKAQELVEKHKALPPDIEWHMIGHLQTNKVKYIAPFVSYIHSVDSLKLLREINKHAAKCNRVIDCLLQIHIAREESKFGFIFEELKSLLKEGEFPGFSNMRIVGLMGMATLTDDHELIRGEFHMLADHFINLKSDVFKEKNEFREISMGMSGDYRIAIEEGSTMVRIGSLIFGPRR